MSKSSTDEHLFRDMGTYWSGGNPALGVCRGRKRGLALSRSRGFTQTALTVVTDRGPFDAHADRRAPRPGPIESHVSAASGGFERSSGIASRIRPGSPRRHGHRRNYAAAASLILLGYAFYATVPYATEVTRVDYDRLHPPGELGGLPGRRRCVSAAAPALLRDILR